MDLKVNDVSGVTQTQEVNQTKPTDDGFKFTLASAIDDAELKEKLSGLMDEITEQGKKISEHMDIRDMKKYGYRVCIDLKPALPPEKLYKRVSEDFALLANREAANCLVKLLPASMQPVMLDVWGMDPQRKVNQITREERRRLVELLKAFPVELAGKGDLAHAVVTSGGVSVKEVDPKTMQSKLCPGLYFAGEILDVDGECGGYNLQWAYSSARVVAAALNSSAVR